MVHLRVEVVGQRRLAQLLEDRAAALGLQRVLDELLGDRRARPGRARCWSDVLDERARDARAGRRRELLVEALVLDRDDRVLASSARSALVADEDPALVGGQGRRCCRPLVVVEDRVLRVLELRAAARAAGRSEATAIIIPKTGDEREHGRAASRIAQQPQLLEALARSCGGAPRRRRRAQAAEMRPVGSLMRRARAACRGRRGRAASGVGGSARRTAPTSSIGPVWLPPAEIAAGAAPQTPIEALPDGAPGAPSWRRLRGGPAAARQARDRPDRARHPPRPHRRAAEAARVPGRRATGRPDRRRLHGARRRPERALGQRPVLSRRGDRRQRRRPTRSRRSRSSTATRAARGPAQQRVAGHAGEELLPAAAARPPSRGCSSATTSPSGWRPASRSRCSSCSTRCCRATTRSRSRPTSSSAAPTRPSTCCSGRDVQRAYGQPEQVDPDDADPGRDRRRARR